MYGSFSHEKDFEEMVFMSLYRHHMYVFGTAKMNGSSLYYDVKKTTPKKPIFAIFSFFAKCRIGVFNR
jgi:hypothetical protein